MNEQVASMVLYECISNAWKKSVLGCAPCGVIFVVSIGCRCLGALVCLCRVRWRILFILGCLVIVMFFVKTYGEWSVDWCYVRERVQSVRSCAVRWVFLEVVLTLSGFEEVSLCTLAVNTASVVPGIGSVVVLLYSVQSVYNLCGGLLQR